MFVLILLLGVTWIFGVFTIGEEMIFFEYLFSILNTLQVNTLIFEHNTNYTQKGKSDQPGSHVFRGLICQFSTDFHGILQTPFFKRISTALQNS